MIGNLEKVIREMTGVGNFDIQHFASDPKYSAYRNIPKHVCSYMDHFRVNYKHEEVNNILGIFYLLLKAIDDEMDENNKTGLIFLNRFKDTNFNNDYECKSSTSIILTDALRELTLPQHEQVLDKLTRLYEAVLSERKAGNMAELIERRKNTGRHTASTSLQVMLPYIERNPAFETFFLNLGEFGNLVDTSIDLGHDGKNKELNFKPNLADRASLYAATLREGISMLVSYPFLFSEYPKFGIITTKSMYDRARQNS